MEEAQQIDASRLVESVEQAYDDCVLEALLKDRTTGKNIIWATDEYEKAGVGYASGDEIVLPRITGSRADMIQPRFIKDRIQQDKRTKGRAEVFTPSWLCDRINGYADARKSTQSWTDYVECRMIEIACGEAPFICSRYDAVTGEPLPVSQRVGFFDRKLHAVSRNTSRYEEWQTWALQALQSSYGYEYQGDSLFLARMNVLETFAEHMEWRWESRPSGKKAMQASVIISWNVWQMDGLTGAVPSIQQADKGQEKSDSNKRLCRIFDWKTGRPQLYVSLRTKGGNS